MATVFRAPLYSLRGSPSVSRVPHTAQADVWTNPLLTLRAPVVVLPFNQKDWPNPRGKPFPIEGRTIADGWEFWLLKDKFFGAAGQPPSPFHQPNPRGYTYPIETRTWTQDLYRLASKDVFFGAPGESKTYDWTNPRLRPFPIENLSLVDSGLALSTPVAQAPFTQDDWPNPRVAGFPLSNRFFAFYYVTDDSLPFVVTDWPNPLRPLFPLENRTEVDPTEFWLLKDTFFGAPGQPPSPFHQPNPRGYPTPMDGRSWVQDLVRTVLAPQPIPFNQDDWPNPRGKVHVITLRTWAEFTRLLGKDTFFGGAGKPVVIWPQPNPNGPRRSIDLRTLLGSNAVFLTSGVPATADFIVLIPGDDLVILIPPDADVEV